jgi:DNA-binding NarL/FixJ family response regulator
MQNHPKLTVIIDDHPLILNGLKDIIIKTEWNTRVETFRTYFNLKEFLKNNQPDLFLIDLQLEEIDGRDIISEYREQLPNCKIIAISSFEDPTVINSAFNSGTNGYLIKNLTFSEMLEGIKAIWKGEKYCQKEVNVALAQKDSTIESFGLPRLTSREKEILKLIVKEKTTKEIAETLFLSNKTICKFK